MKVVIIFALFVVLLITMVNLNEELAQGNIVCTAEGLILYDGYGLEIEQPEEGDVQLRFRDMNGDKVEILNNAECTVDWD